MCENSQSSVDETIHNDDVLGVGGSINIEQKGPVTLSKKAIHQQDADENLFLRFLELDPPAEAQPSPAQPSTSDLRRKSTLKSKDYPILKEQKEKEHPVAASSHNQNGRTPFTVTKKLIRTTENGFGFSIVWTHPPRIEKVEAGLSADRCGILPGDYVIFVDKHNVVTMPEMDILNLIKAQGNTLILEIFRRNCSASKASANGVRARAESIALSVPINIIDTNQEPVAINNNDDVISSECATPKQSISSFGPRPMTACSNISLTLDSTTKQRLHLRPQVTFSKESMLTSSIEDAPRKYLYQLINREQHFITALQYGIQRFLAPLQERRDLISPTDQRTLFQNIEEILRLSEDILEQLLPDDREPNLLFASRVYLTKSTTFCAAYKKYCNGLKRADCVLVNKSRQSNSEFVTFITVPQVPRKRPDLTSLIHRPLQHFREVLKLIILLASQCRSTSEECTNLTMVITALQTSYREITVSEGLMEPLGEGRLLLTLQDLEARLVFTKCKPFVLAVPGRQWIFGGDLSRVEGRSVKPFWTLLFSDILLFAKVSRDRVLFITEDPIPLANVIDSCFNIRKKHTEFRITIDPNGRVAESPTINCAPDLTRAPSKSARKFTLILRAPSPELKAVWQNLLQRQIFLVNATLGSTLSSPLESPDILQQFIPMNDISAATTSMPSIKLSADSINTKSQQVRLQTFNKQQTIHNSLANNNYNDQTNDITTTSFIEISKHNNSMPLASIFYSAASVKSLRSDCTSSSLTNPKLNTIFEQPTPTSSNIPPTSFHLKRSSYPNKCNRSLEFSISSVGRSFIDESTEMPFSLCKMVSDDVIATPDTPEPNISPSSSIASKSFFSETFLNDSLKPSTPSVIVSPIDEHHQKYASSTATNNTNGSSWDRLELDLDFHHVNFDPSFGGDVQEQIFLGETGILPFKPTEPDSHDL